VFYATYAFSESPLPRQGNRLNFRVTNGGEAESVVIL